MNLKRTMNQALHAGNLTAEEAFVAAGVGGAAARVVPAVSEPVNHEPRPPALALPPSALRLAPAELPVAHTPLPAQRQAPVSVTFRLPPELPAALLRAAMERKLRGEKPCTQQDIVAEALRTWLETNAPRGG